MKRARRKSNRVKISFAATILVLALVTVLAYTFSFKVPQYSIPSNLQPYTGLVGMYSPTDALQVTFDNLTAIRAINASAVPDKQLVNLVTPRVKVDIGQVSDQVLVTLLQAGTKVNNSAVAAILSQGAFSNMSNALARSGFTPVRYDGFDLYNVSDHANGRTTGEWMTLVPSDSAVVFSEGTSGAQATVMKMLDVREGKSPSILSFQNVTRMLYPVGGVNHLALSIQAFPGQVLTSDMGVVAVDDVSGSVQLRSVIRVANSAFASSQVSYVQSSYRNARDFSQYD